MPTQDLPCAITLLPVPECWPPPEVKLEAASRTPASPAPERLAAGAGLPWPRQFAAVLAEGLAGVRPVRQLLPWMSEQGSSHLHRLLPLFADGHRPRLQRVLTAQPSTDVIEMTIIAAFGPRTRALAVRLEQTGQALRPQWRCTAIEAA